MDYTEHNKALLNHLVKLADIGHNKLTIRQRLQKRYALGVLRDRGAI